MLQQFLKSNGVLPSKSLILLINKYCCYSELHSLTYFVEKNLIDHGKLLVDYQLEVDRKGKLIIKLINNAGTDIDFLKL